MEKKCLQELCKNTKPNYKRSKNGYDKKQIEIEKN